jgi:hypothetical protein
MQRDQIQIGNTYTAKVTDKVVPVRIDAEDPNGGWTATNLVTNKKVRIKTAQRLREEVRADTAAVKRPVRKKLAAAERQALRAQHKADQENARVRDERARAKDGMTDSERAMAESAPQKSMGVAKPAKPKKASGLDAAFEVLKKAKEPMASKDIVEKMLADGMWSTDGKTPHATIYAAMVREIQSKGKDARFIKIERGRFAAGKGA